MNDDETPAFWSGYSHDDLVVRVASLHAQRRELGERIDELTVQMGAVEIKGARTAIAATYLRGFGMELGAGNRPFPLPEGVRCHYGDIRGEAALAKYFSAGQVAAGDVIDAQTMLGVPPASQDFVIYAHVIEHLYDPIGAIRAVIGVLKPGGVFVCVVPDMEKTFDKARPPTTLAHVMTDRADGGQSTKLQAYVEHVKYVHPTLTGEHFDEKEIERRVRAAMEAGMDLHVHAWRARDFSDLLNAISTECAFSFESMTSVVNENICVLRRRV
jgi:SAM-dependent methyltransferase